MLAPTNQRAIVRRRLGAANWFRGSWLDFIEELHCKTQPWGGQADSEQAGKLFVANCIAKRSLGAAKLIQRKLARFQ